MSLKNVKPDCLPILSYIEKLTYGQFVIPVYQRTYTWTRKEIEQFLKDLKKTISSNNGEHFFGIIIYLEKKVSATHKEYQVIDGQQRLTTMFLSLYALKQICDDRNEVRYSQMIYDKYLDNKNSDIENRLKLKPLVSDDDVFKHIADNTIEEIPDEIKKKSNVYSNYIMLKKSFEDLLSDSSISIEDLISKGIEKFYAVVINLEKEHNPQKIFESINSTGVKLTHADLIRNFILMDVSNNEQERLYKTYWNKIEIIFKQKNDYSKEMESFFRFYLATKIYKLINKNKIYEEFKEWYESQKKDNTNLDINFLLDDIYKYAKYYDNLYIKKISDINKMGDKLKKSIAEFRKNESDMPAPFLLKLYDFYDSENELKILEDEFVEIINILNTYLIRRSLCELDTSDITRLFPMILKNVVDKFTGNNNIVDIVKRYLINEQINRGSRMPDDKELKDHLLDKNVNFYKIKKTIKIVFDKIESKNNAAPIVDLSELSIEHLMPQNATDEWLECLGGISSDEYNSYLNRIGNLTLISKKANSIMGCKPYEYKKIIIEEIGHLMINKYLEKIDKWTIEEIENRSNVLAGLILDAFPYTKSNLNNAIKKTIYIDNNNLKTIALFNVDDGSVEILKDSTFKKYPKYETEVEKGLKNTDNFDMYDELIDDGVIEEKDEYAIFLENYEFFPKRKGSTALSTSSNFILCTHSNGWKNWRDENNQPIEENDTLKAKYKKDENN